MDWIQTFTGRRFHPLAPDPAEIDVRDIAHSLALLCRFNGHCRGFYSVADHSVRVSRLLDGQLALAGLLHDAGEAYVSDLPRPVKGQMPQFDVIEDVIVKVVFDKYDLPFPLPPEVKRADDALLATEMRDLMAEPPEPWGLREQPLSGPIEPLSPTEAEAAFLARFAELTGTEPLPRSL
jgi:uncharacterized protein